MSPTRNLQDVGPSSPDDPSANDALIMAGCVLLLIVVLVILRHVFNMFIDIAILRDFDSVRRSLVELRRWLCPWWRPRTSPQQEGDEVEGNVEAATPNPDAQSLLQRKTVEERRSIVDAILCSKTVTLDDLNEWKKCHRECESSRNDCSESTTSHEGCICSICIHDIDIGSVAVTTNPCNHVFHKDCLAEWLVVRNIFCPYCRNPDIITLEAVQEAAESLSTP